MSFKEETVYIPHEDENVISLGRVDARRALERQARLEGYDSRKEFMNYQREQGILETQTVLNAINGVSTLDYLAGKEALGEEQKQIHDVEISSLTEKLVTAEEQAENYHQELSEQRINSRLWAFRAVSSAVVALSIITMSYLSDPISNQDGEAWRRFDHTAALVEYYQQAESDPNRSLECRTGCSYGLVLAKQQKRTVLDLIPALLP